MGSREGRPHCDDSPVRRSHVGPLVAAGFLFKSLCVLQSLDVVGVAAQSGIPRRTSASSFVRREAREQATGDPSQDPPAVSPHPAAKFFAARAAKRRERDRGSGGRLVQGGLGDAVEVLNGAHSKGASSEEGRNRGVSSKFHGDGDEHVVDNYGTSTSVSRMVNEKSFCQGACGDAWDDSTIEPLDDGRKVHGLFSANSTSSASISRTLVTNASHSMVRVSMIFWSIGQWGVGDEAFLKINGVKEWSKTRDYTRECGEWSLCGKKITNAVSPLCCQLVSKSMNHNGTSVVVEIGSTIDETKTNESFAMSDFIFDVISEKT